MIGVQEAQERIVQQVNPLGKTSRALHEACGYTLYEDILAPLSIPPFPQSAMDGYAIRYEDFEKFDSFKMVGEIPAGTTKKAVIREGETMRIFTGAPVPDGAGMVIMQENAEVKGESVVFFQSDAKKGLNIREIGEQIKQGTLALAAKHTINERSIGLLASLGISTIQVFKKPKIGILITGDELQPPGETLQYGQIYESNGEMLRAVLMQFGFDVEITRRATDNLGETEQILSELIDRVDVVLTSGGISVGKYDFIKAASEKNQFNEVFYKIRQKPGKPLYFAKNQDTYLFALPGNPASLLVCFYFYVLPALRILAGSESTFLPEKRGRLTHDYEKKGTRSQFLKALVHGSDVSLQQFQSSFDMYAFAHSNCMVFLPEKEKSYKKGDDVTIFELPN